MDTITFIRRNLDSANMRAVGAALYIGQQWYKFLQRLCREDFYQTAALAATEAATLGEKAEENGGQAMFRIAHRHFRSLARARGFRYRQKRWVQNDQLETELVNSGRGIPQPENDSSKETGRIKGWAGKPGGATAGSRRVTHKACGVPGCPQRSSYNDERFGRLCLRHNSVVSVRRRRGWEDPYKDLPSLKPAAQPTPCGVPGCDAPSTSRDERFQRLCTRHTNRRNQRLRHGWSDPYQGWVEDQEKEVRFASFPVPNSFNRTFWEKVREKLTPEEWAALWMWALEEVPHVGEEILEKARSAGSR